ncbi:MAG: isochorismate synthase [Elainellaceae cyanobacterium]
MLIKPHCTNLLQHPKNLYQFLLTCQQSAVKDHHFKIASITVETEFADALSVLYELCKHYQNHFYFEKRLEQDSVVAIANTVLFQTHGANRFLAAQDFVQSISNHVIQPSLLSDCSVLPRFFCAFTFEDNTHLTSPFPAATVFLPRWQVTQQGRSHWLTVNLLIDADSDLSQMTQAIISEFQFIQTIRYSISDLSNSFENSLDAWQISDIHDFETTVSSVLKCIQNHQLNKLVLAHAVDVISYLPFQWIHCLNNLRQLHSDCCVFSIGQQPNTQFVGASPERLISIRHNHLVIDALAGSAPRGQTLTDDAELANRLLSSPKERHEHQLVVDFIVQSITRFGLKPRYNPEPSLLQLANIQHLHTPIQAVLSGQASALELLATIHPTPAIAGLPRDVACQHIAQYEPFERSLYAGALGWVDTQGNSEFIVGIRSALLKGQYARLYAGAGIVIGSDPKRELAEIRLKLRALLQALV